MTREKMIERKRKQLIAEMDDFVSEQVEAEANAWLAKHPLPDDEIETIDEAMLEDGFMVCKLDADKHWHVKYIEEITPAEHEEALHDFKIDAAEYLTKKYMEELLPAALEEYEMHLEVE